MEHIFYIYNPAPTASLGCCPAPSSLPHGAASNYRSPSEREHPESCSWGVSNPPSMAQPQCFRLYLNQPDGRYGQQVPGLLHKARRGAAAACALRTGRTRAVNS